MNLHTRLWVFQDGARGVYMEGFHVGKSLYFELFKDLIISLTKSSFLKLRVAMVLLDSACMREGG